ncbi:virion protein [uncultured Caudovirales phage]|uniref:Virion protein n=1 Tax=uncultured Caudovirales phage TaxID=2100421 RepID=A0A6J5LVD4_9CAUD|nr:virion protein [uncultured Caudovirales phage]
MQNALRQPRGIRNHNPGNLRRSNDRWRGLAEKQTDAEFFQFVDPVFGIRAMAIVLMKYQRTHGLRTVTSIINRWAPARGDRNGEAPGGEYQQNTNAYAQHVARYMGISHNHEINLAKQASLFYLMLAAMIRHENGVQPYPRATIFKALELANVPVASLTTTHGA